MSASVFVVRNSCTLQFSKNRFDLSASLFIAKSSTMPMFFNPDFRLFPTNECVRNASISSDLTVVHFSVGNINLEDIIASTNLLYKVSLSRSITAEI